MTIGSGIAVFGIWGAVAICAAVAPGEVFVFALCAVFATMFCSNN
jgi:hypothetical protein